METFSQTSGKELSLERLDGRRGELGIARHDSWMTLSARTESLFSITCRASAAITHGSIRRGTYRTRC